MDETKKLVGFCDVCQEWYKFIEPARACTSCGGKPSVKVGFQITTQRTFNPSAKKMTKAQMKKMSLGA